MVEPQREITSSGTTRRSLIGGAIATTAVAALGGASTALAGAGTRREITPASAPGGAYRFDLHAHFIPPDYRLHLTRNRQFTVPWTLEDHLRFMDNWGIQKSVVSVPQNFHFGNQAETNAVARKANEDGRALLDAHGDRFAVLAALPLPDVDAALAELSYALDTLKLDAGVMLFSHYEGTYLGDPAYSALYAELDRRRLVAWIHPTFPLEEPIGPFQGAVLEFPFETTRAATNIIYKGLLYQFPNIRWQLSHAGGTLPFLLFRLASLQMHPASQLPPTPPQGPFTEARKFWWDTGFAGSEEQLLSMRKLMGTDKVVFGTDWPFTDHIHAPTAHVVAPWFSEMLPKDGDPQPALSRVYTSSQRMTIERRNALELYPGLVRAE